MFKRKPKAPGEKEFRGPLDIFPGDQVHYYQQEFTLAGVVFLVTGKERRCQYHFLDADEMHVVMSFEPGEDPRITLERPLLEEECPDLSGEAVEFDGTDYRREEPLAAAAFCMGGIPAEKGAKASLTMFADSDEMEFIAVEDWNGYVEVRRGEEIHENELVIRRQRDEDDWDIRPPPRIDLRSMNEARRSKAIEARRHEEKAKSAEMAGARAKLAAFHEESDVEEAADVVALSDIVDVRHRFPDEETDPALDPAPEDEAEDEEVEEPEEVETTPTADGPRDDPFSGIFEEDEADHLAAAAPPMPQYPDDDGEDEEEEIVEEESSPLFPVEESPAAFITDGDEDDFLSTGIFGDDDDILEA